MPEWIAFKHVENAHRKGKDFPCNCFCFFFVSLYPFLLLCKVVVGFYMYFVCEGISFRVVPLFVLSFCVCPLCMFDLGALVVHD